MLCDSCQERDAVVHLTTIENNAVRQLHLCEQCAAERGVETTVATPKHPLGEFLAGGAAAVGAGAAPTRRGARSAATTMTDFRATGRLGCARCYATFEPSMRELLRRVHGNPRHVGRSYRAADAGAARAARRCSASCASGCAARSSSEQFELAAELRDRITGDWNDARSLAAPRRRGRLARRVGRALGHRALDAHPPGAERRGLRVHRPGARRRAAARAVAGARGAARACRRCAKRCSCRLDELAPTDRRCCTSGTW